MILKISRRLGQATALTSALPASVFAQAMQPAQVQPPVTSAPQSSFTTSQPPASALLPAPSAPTPAPSPLPIDTERTDAAIDRGTALGSPAAPSARPAPERNVERQGGVRNAGPLPSPVDRPLGITSAGDPILALGQEAGSATAFRAVVAAAVDRNPALNEAQANEDEARAQRREAQAGLYPSADVSVSSYGTIARDFSNDPQNIIERSRPRARTDAQLAINQPLLDFGATANRITAANARLRAAAAGIDDIATQVTLRTIGAWYDIFTYRSLIVLAEGYRANQAARRSDLDRRIVEGASAPADISQLLTSIAGIDTRIARYRRQLANAEARFAELTGRPAPPLLPRAPLLGALPASSAEARALAANVPAVQASGEQAAAARREARAVKRSTLPSISAGIDAGRYGVFENERDYDVRGRITLRQQLGGALYARADQAEARANGAQARAARVLEEAGRDAAIAWSDVEALARQTTALEASYIAARQSRDTIEARFVASRGTLFDVINANDTYFASAAAYVESLADRDSAHYALLARTGRLLESIGIAAVYRKAGS